MPEMTETRLLDLIGAYGSDPQRWPRAERAAALTRLQASDAGQQLLAAEASLDVVMASDPAPAVEPRLRQRVLSIPALEPAPRPSPVRPGLARRMSPFVEFWQPAAGLAAAALVGFAVGLATPPTPDLVLDQEQVESYVAVIIAAGGQIEEFMQ